MNLLFFFLSAKVGLNERDVICEALVVSGSQVCCAVTFLINIFHMKML